MPEKVAESDETREKTHVHVEVRDLDAGEQQERIDQRNRLNPGGGE